ncbi:MAG: 2-C-methyl-D-erythritol 2,4-cyclodiphosphate synthase [candidate division Zixibacteria bacterium]|nr:2-C-methyl-D-erythritol 2,4-cyclodiphosphate synthase [candidate division Zixibacteria bacterium]
MTEIRIGSGFDVHKLVEDRDLVIGGVRIPYERGLEGHSDADVLLHAIMDALLGAAGLPDIGQQYPPSDPAYKDADSKGLLAQVVRIVQDAGFGQIVNIDATIIAERPKMANHIPAMKTAIANLLKIDPGRVNVKATTTEGLGYIGREEGIAASAVCLISNDG